MKPLVASYSFLNDEETCPHKAWHKYVLRDVPFETSKPLEEGRALHSGMERRLRENTPLPAELNRLEPLALSVLARRDVGATLLVEQQIGMTEQGVACDFLAPHVWLRGKLDCVLIEQDQAHMLDWKNGKVRENPFELEVGALLLKAQFPILRKITGQYVWVNQQPMLGPPYDLSDTQATWRTVRDTMNNVRLRAGEWPKRQGPLCGWCPVKKCEHWRERR